MTAPLFEPSPAPAAPAPVDLAVVLRTLQAYRFPIGHERVFQDAVAAVLDASGIPFAREKDLGDYGRIDFFLRGGVGLELKVGGSLSDVTRQLHRYALCPDIMHLVLVTGRARLGRLPDTLNGKPVTVAAVWGGLL